MSTVDEAVEAGARAFYEDLTDWRMLVSVEPMVAQAYRDSMARAARSMWPVLSAGLRELHRPFGIFELEDCCTDTTDEHREEHHHECADEYGEFYCDELPIGHVCDECRDGEGERVAHPCPTVQELDRIDRELGIGSGDQESGADHE